MQREDPFDNSPPGPAAIADGGHVDVALEEVSPAVRRVDLGLRRRAHRLRAIAGRQHAGTLSRRALVAADVVVGGLALVAAAVVQPDQAVEAGALTTLPLLVVLIDAHGLYRRDEHLINKTTLEESARLFQVATLWSLLTWLFTGLITGHHLTPGQVFILWALVFMLMVAGRALTRRALRDVTPPERCLVVGDAAAATTLHRKFEVSFALRGRVIGRIPLGDDSRRNGHDAAAIPVVGSLAGLGEALSEHEVDRVIIAPRDFDDGIDAIRIARDFTVKVSVLPRVLEAVGSALEFDDADGLTLMGLRRSSPGVSYRLKRAMDVTAAAASLILLAPVIALIALMIKIDSRGPVLYRQKRIGRNSQEFWMLKFRSMTDGADAEKAALLALNETVGLFKIARDPRVTRIGRLLRETSLDELPQLWNVLRGDMSLVGPRPLVPEDDAQIQGWERKRLNVTPGMTGLWQILGSTRVPLEDMVKLDYLYGVTWSLWLDIKILLRTVAYVLNRRSA